MEKELNEFVEKLKAAAGANLRAVVFVQERRSRRVLAAANIAFSAQ